MTPKVTRSFRVLRGTPSFVVVLIVLIGLAALAQTRGTGEASGKSRGAPARGGVAPSGADSTNPSTAPFLTGETYSSGGYAPTSIAMGDLNRDDRLDVVVANWCASKNSCTSGSLSVLLGNGDGTFQLRAPILSGGKDPSSVAISDFNRDGSLDVVIANFCGAKGKGCRAGGHGSVTVLLGNGNGTLQTPVSYTLVGVWPKSLAVADFNGDGRLDLAVADCLIRSDFCHDSVEILLGKADGTFQSAVRYDAGPGDCANSVAIADFNGDGKLDLAVADACQTFVSILLGNGDGTFQPALTYALRKAPWFIAIGDFNGDGEIDLAGAEITNSGAFDAIVLSGHGDGSFDPPAEYPTGGFSPMSVAVGDFNQDGKLDLAVTNSCGPSQQPCKSNGTVAVLLGKGDGSFQFPVNYDSQGRDPLLRIQMPEGPVAVGDLNGDGRADLVVANQCADSACVNGSIAVLRGNGDGTFQGQIVASHYETTATLISTPNPSTVGQPVTFTATVASAGPDVPTGKVKFVDGSVVIGSATLSGGVAKLTKSTLAAGTHPITAQYAGDAASDKTTSLVVNQVVQ